MLQTLGNQFGSIHGNGNGNRSTMDWEPVRALATATTPPVSRKQRQEWRDEGKYV
jgi:hypothetical protein